jgi:hypothetical protein
MNTAFVLGGFILLAGVFGIFHRIKELSTVARWGLIILFALSPLGMIMCGFFTLESIMLHLAGFLLAVCSPVLSFLVAGLVLRRTPNWQPFSRGMFLEGIVTFILLMLYFQTFSPTEAGARNGFAGLIQGTLVLEVHALFAAFGWLTFHHS